MCAQIVGPSLDAELARRFMRMHGDVPGDYGQLTAGSSRSTDGWCRILLNTGVGANKIAETCEHFHLDYLNWITPLGTDKFWRRSHIVEGYMCPTVIDVPTGEAYFSIGIGSPNSVPGPFVYDENYIALRYNAATGHWEAVVCDGGAGIGYQMFDLGALATVHPIFATTFSFKVRVVYKVRQLIEFWLDDKLVYTFTDSATMTSFYDLAPTASDEGGSYFVSTGNNAASQMSAACGPMFCQTFLP